MNINKPIQILTGNGIEVFRRIAAFTSANHQEPTAHVRQTILADRGSAPNYAFHTAMREALGDTNADLVSYNGGTGECYASWVRESVGADGTVSVAVLPRRKDETGKTLPDVVLI